MGPEVDDAEEGPGDGDAVEESGHDGWSADVLCVGELQGFRAWKDKIFVTAAVGLLAGVTGFTGAEGLCAKGGVLGCHEHGDGVVDGKDDEGEHDGCDEECLRGSASAADLEDADPEEADADGGDAGDRAAEEEEDEKGHDDVVDREDLGGLDKDEVDGLEDVDLTQDVAAARLADGVLGLVDTGDEHRGPDEE